jgi:hypothetical protein
MQEQAHVRADNGPCVIRKHAATDARRSFRRTTTTASPARHGPQNRPNNVAVTFLDDHTGDFTYRIN